MRLRGVIPRALVANSIWQAFFMAYSAEISGLIRSGQLHFALLKPIDTQFLSAVRKIEWSSLSNSAFACVLLAYSLWQLDYRPGPVQIVLYPLYVGCGVAILYSLMIVMASISVWLGRNQSLYDF